MKGLQGGREAGREGGTGYLDERWITVCPYESSQAVRVSA